MTMKIEQVELEPQTILGVREVVPMASLTEFFGRAFGQSAAALAQQGASPSGAPVAIYHGMPTDTIDVTAGFPFVGNVEATPGTVVAPLPGGTAIQTIHHGPYDTLSESYAGVNEWIAKQALKAAPEMWEEYLVGPESSPDPSNWQTRIIFPLA